MTIDEAIERLKSDAIEHSYNLQGYSKYMKEQIAEWLEELKWMKETVLYTQAQLNFHKELERNKVIDDILNLPKSNHYDMYNELMYQSIKVSDIEQLKAGNNG